MTTYHPESKAIAQIDVSDDVSDFTVRDDYGRHNLRNKHVVKVTFHDGAEHKYLLTPRQVGEFVNAESVGRYFNEAVRSGWWVTTE
mgnify:CR=1 FL=1